MYEPTLETPLNDSSQAIPWGYASNPNFPPISVTATNQENSLQTYMPNEGSQTDWAVTPVGGLVAAGNVYVASHESDDTPAGSTLGVAMTGFPINAFSMSTPTCGLAGGLDCDLPMDGSVGSIRMHLRRHGRKYPQRQIVQCPWIGCFDTLLWMNIPRHIQSMHLGIRFRCFNCGKLYTRPKGLERHITPLKCNISGEIHVESRT